MAGINASTGQNLSSVNTDSILKDFYLGPVREQLNFSSVLMYRIMRDEESVSGKQVVIPVHTGRNEGISAVADGGYLPDPGKQTWANLKFPVQYMYGRLLLTGPTISAAKNDRGSFLRTLDAAIKGLTRDFKKEMNRVLYGDGSGQLGRATLLTTDPNNEFTAANAFDLDSSNKTQYLRPGMICALIDTAASDGTAGTTNVGAFQVKSVNTSTGKITFETSGNNAATGPDCGSSGTNGWDTNAANNYRIVRASRYTGSTLAGGGFQTTIDETSAWKEPMGLKGIIATGANPTGRSTFEGIDRTDAANSWFNSTIDSSTTDVTFSKLQEMWDNLAINGDGATPTIMLCDYTQRRKYSDLWGSHGADNTGAARRFVNTMTLDGGFEAVEYNGVPMVAEVDCPPGHIFFLHEPDLAIFRNEDYFWLDRDGKVLHRLEDKDAYQATLAIYNEFGCYRGNTHGALTALDES